MTNDKAGRQDPSTGELMPRGSNPNMLLSHIREKQESAFKQHLRHNVMTSHLYREYHIIYVNLTSRC